MQMRILTTVVLLAAALCFHVASMAASGGPPKIDAAATCKASIKAVVEAIGDQTRLTLENCLKQEQEAQEHLVKQWSSFAAADVQVCINTTVYMPSYVEWLSCLETRSAVRKLPKQ